METFIINARGSKFEMSENTFHKLSGKNSSMFLREATRISSREYFLERSPMILDAVLQFISCGELHLPANVCPHLFINELQFWGVHLEDVNKCCQDVILSAVETRMILDKYEQNREDKKDINGKNSFRHCMWLTLNNPSYSLLSKVYAAIIGIFILLSIFVMAAKTHPYFQIHLDVDTWREYLGDSYSDVITEYDYYDESDGDRNITLTKAFITPQYFHIIDYIATAFFTADFLLRLLVSPRKSRLLCDSVFWADIVALLAIYSHYFVELFARGEKYRENAFDIIEALQVLRIMRFVRILKAVRVFRILAYSLKTGYKEFLVVVTFILLGVMTFGCVIYYVDGKSKIKHIPDGMYWALITITTVGYGDLIPDSFLGKFVAGFLALSGSLLLSAIVPVFVNNFLFYYKHTTDLTVDSIPIKCNKIEDKHEIKTISTSNIVYVKSTNK